MVLWCYAADFFFISNLDQIKVKKKLSFTFGTDRKHFYQIVFYVLMLKQTNKQRRKALLIINLAFDGLHIAAD